ncbi:MAG: hypothetical protein ABIT01_17775 [Thermoanaerobaculia bacterium]
MFERKILRPFLLAAACSLGTSGTLQAQETTGFAYDGPVALRGTFRTVNGEWQAIPPPRRDGMLRIGDADSAVPISSVVLKQAGGLWYQVLVAGKWQDWAQKGKPAGDRKTPLGGIKVRTENGSIRYRASSLAGGLGEWAEDNEAALAPDKGPVNSIEIQWRALARKEATLEFRAQFAGQEFTPWLKGGAQAQAEKAPAELIGLAIRNGNGIRYEVALNMHWQPTAIDGESTGDPTGKHRVTSFRVFGGSSPVRYRVKPEGAGWSPWFQSGQECPEPGSNRPLLAIQIEPDRGGR